jgi:hypothetical protein
MGVDTVKTQLDSFFSTLDGGTASAPVDPNYFIVSIVPLTWDSINTLQAQRNSQDTAVGALKTWAVDRGDRYLSLGEKVGNGSISLNIADSDYNPVLDSIGRAITEKKGTFTLNRAPTSQEDMIVSVLHVDGSTTTIPDNKYNINGKSIVINDLNVVLGFKSTDRIVINYQPKTVF